MDVTVLVGTYGDGYWGDLARERAIPSADALGVPVIHVHSHSLHEARNEAAELATTEWLAFLDADDELEPGYFKAMERATADLRVPEVRYVRPTFEGFPVFPRVAGHEHQCEAACLIYGNWMVVGTLIRSAMLHAVGGWRDFEWSEDWDLWLRCHLAGASIEAVPGAVYRAHVRFDSRNRAQSQEARNASHRAIAMANGV